jgi:transposase-like protein
LSIAGAIGELVCAGEILIRDVAELPVFRKMQASMARFCLEQRYEGLIIIIGIILQHAGRWNIDQRMRTSNGLERLHEELRHRSRVVRILPNRGGCLRLSTALVMEQSEEWLTGHRYLNMQVLEEEPEEIKLALDMAEAIA